MKMEMIWIITGLAMFNIWVVLLFIKLDWMVRRLDYGRPGNNRHSIGGIKRLLMKRVKQSWKNLDQTVFCTGRPL